ncbi:FMN-binding negative transcriptional regulator [Streptomyces sp. NPDC058867]|uniref:FMN-binding negative transcriptional regulator n=1 Tax=Streptomyces TaxID=1883 RepID=UPI003686DB7A
MVVAFLGPSAYISPDHYASQPHFPTWAYAAVHVTGRPRLLDEVRTMRQLDDLIEDQESRLAPKQPWSLPRRASALFDEYLRLIQGSRSRSGTSTACTSLARTSPRPTWPPRHGPSGSAARTA